MLKEKLKKSGFELCWELNQSQQNGEEIKSKPAIEIKSKRF